MDDDDHDESGDMQEVEPPTKVQKVVTKEGAVIRKGQSARRRAVLSASVLDANEDRNMMNIDEEGNLEDNNMDNDHNHNPSTAAVK